MEVAISNKTESGEVPVVQVLNSDEFSTEIQASNQETYQEQVSLSENLSVREEESLVFTFEVSFES